MISLAEREEIIGEEIRIGMKQQEKNKDVCPKKPVHLSSKMEFTIRSSVLDQPAWFMSHENNKRWNNLSRSKEHSGWALTVKAGPEGSTIRDHRHDNANGI